jgi:hypothetical protein
MLWLPWASGNAIRICTLLCLCVLTMLKSLTYIVRSSAPFYNASSLSRTRTAAQQQLSKMYHDVANHVWWFSHRQLPTLPFSVGTNVTFCSAVLGDKVLHK